MILAGVMLKLGTYGLLRFGVYLFPEAARWCAPLFLTLAVIGIIYGAIAATMQKDLKRLVAYSSVAHLGFIVLGTFALTTQSITGGVMQMVNHGVSTGALFLLVGMIYERRHTREISELKGLQKVAPIFAAVFTVVMLSSIGVPGLNGFVGEYLDPDRLVPHRPVVGGGRRDRRDPRRALPAVGLPAGVPRRARRGQQVLPGADAGRRAWCCCRSSALIVFIGVYPKPMLDRIEPSVEGADRPRRGARPATSSRSRRRRSSRPTGSTADARRRRLRRARRSTGSRSPRCSSCSAAALVLLVVAALTPAWPRGTPTRRSPSLAAIAAIVLSFFLWRRASATTARRRWSAARCASTTSRCS